MHKKKSSFFLLIVLLPLFLEAGSRFLLFIKERGTERHTAIIQEKGYVRLKPNYEYRSKDSNEKYSINSLGYRGREINKIKPKNKIRIVALGGSITFGSGTSDNEHTYSALLEEYLDEQIDKATFADYSIEVVNAGIPGLRADSLLIYLKEKVLELKPDIVIIFSGWNDWNYFLTQGYQVFDYQSPIYRLNMMLTENSVFIQN